jgi:hypothetical protein
VSTKPPAPNEVRQVLVHPVVWPALEAWLAGRGIDLCPVPVEDDLPTYCMQPRLLDTGEQPDPRSAP